MNQNSTKLKLILGTIYLIILSIGLYFLFTSIDIKDLMSYEFIRSNRDIIFKYKSENFLFLNIIFFIFSVLWILFLGFVFPLLIFSGFVFGKWWGTLIAVVAVSIGATLLYIIGKYFFYNFIKQKFSDKYIKLEKKFKKNEFSYFIIYRFIGGIPFAIANVLPVLFNVSIKNYFLGTFFGILPQLFIISSLGSGLEKVILENSSIPSLYSLILTKENELVQMSSFLVFKNEMINTISKDLDYHISLVKSKIEKKSFNPLVKKIKNELSMSNDWLIFQKQFANLYPNFISILTNQHDGLTSNDIKICCYLKMNQTTKDIAHLTGLSIRATENRRYRLRKKLKLDKNCNLLTYLHNLKI